MNNQKFWQRGTRLGIFLAILFLGCFAWYYLRSTTAEMKVLHESLLRQAFFGWSGMNLVSFVLGLIQAFIWGYIALALWAFSGLIAKGFKQN